MLMGSLALGAHGQNLNDLPIETDPHKYIPGEATNFSCVTIKIKGIEKKYFNVYWYDKNNNLVIEDDEMFIDINGDFVPDMLFTDFLNWYSHERTKKELRRTSG